MSAIFVVGLLLTDRKVSPLAWTKEKPSKKELRRITKKFRNDADFEAPYCAPWERLYDSAEEAKKSLPEI